MAAPLINVIWQQSADPLLLPGGAGRFQIHHSSICLSSPLKMSKGLNISECSLCGGSPDAPFDHLTPAHQLNQQVSHRSPASFCKAVCLDQTLTVCQDRRGPPQIAAGRCRWRRVSDSACFLLGAKRVADRRPWPTCRVEEAGGA